jgi:hypothetical protein
MVLAILFGKNGATRGRAAMGVMTVAIKNAGVRQISSLRRPAVLFSLNSL